MNDAEIAEIREKLAWIQQRFDLAIEDDYFRDIYNAAWNLLAHIDAQAAEITDREGKYVDLLRTKHALTAEVARLKAHMAECDRQEILRVSSLRDLVREADGIIGDAYGSHYDARLSAADRCPWCKRAAAWREKAQA